MTDTPLSYVDRRNFLRQMGASAAFAALAAACGPALAPEVQPSSGSGSLVGSKDVIKLGFIALTDCASLVMAQELGLFKQYGLNVEVIKQASWAATRDNLLSGEIDGAHCLFGMPFSVYTGVGGQAGKELQIAMVLNNNGQAITLAKDQFGGKVGFKDTSRVSSVVSAMASSKEPTFAMTFPGGTHDMWLRYWLAAANVDPKIAKIITIPPAQMVANMKVGNMDGYCVGEPWGGVAAKDGIGFTHITTQDLWKHHPEKALVVRPEFSAQRREDLKLVMRAILEASKYIDDQANKVKVGEVIGQQSFVNASAEIIQDRLAGKYDLGASLGKKDYMDDTMWFTNNGFVNAPRKSHAAWFMAQYVRFGYLKTMPEAKAIADKLILSDLYREVAKDMSIPVPDDDMAPFSVDLDGARFDPADPGAYLKKYGGIA